MVREKIKVELSKELIEKIKNRIKETEFKNPEEYIDFVLEELLKDGDLDEKFNNKIDSEYNKEDEEKIKERLKALGYVD
jgi:Arc/MetJ-type ribon-helix-helix transcriptional regulator